jgi:hypothetical protein
MIVARTPLEPTKGFVQYGRDAVVPAWSARVTMPACYESGQ